MAKRIANFVTFGNHARFHFKRRSFVHVEHANHAIQGIHQVTLILRENSHRVFRIRIILRRCVSERFVVQFGLRLYSDLVSRLVVADFKEVRALLVHRRNRGSDILPGDRKAIQVTSIDVFDIVFEHNRTLRDLFFDTDRKDLAILIATVFSRAVFNTERIGIILTIRILRIIDNDFRLFIDVLNLDSHFLQDRFNALISLYISAVLIHPFAVFNLDFECVYSLARFIVHLGRILDNNQGVLHRERNRVARGFDNGVFLNAEFRNMLHIWIICNDKTHRGIFPEIFFRIHGELFYRTLIFVVQVLHISNNRSFVDIPDIDHTTERIAHSFRIFGVNHIDGHRMTQLNRFIVKFGAINDRENDSPLAIILNHSNIEQTLGIGIIRIHERSFKLLVSRSNVLVHDNVVEHLVAARRMFINFNGQDLSRIARGIAILDTDRIHFVLAVRADANILAFGAVAVRNDLRTFVIIRHGDCHLGAISQALIRSRIGLRQRIDRTVDHLDIEGERRIRFQHFIVKDTFVRDHDIVRYHLERRNLFTRNRLDFIFKMSECHRIQDIRILCRNYASSLAVSKIFLDDNDRILARKHRLFVHVDNIDNTTERIAHSIRIFRVLHINRYRMAQLDRFVVKLRAINDRENDSPLAIILNHSNIEQTLGIGIIRIHERSFKLLVSRSNVLVHDNVVEHLVAARRMFINFNGQDLSRIARGIAILDTDRIHFVLAVRADANILAFGAIAIRNDLRTFVIICHGDRHLGAISQALIRSRVGLRSRIDRTVDYLDIEGECRIRFQHFIVKNTFVLDNDLVRFHLERRNLFTFNLDNFIFKMSEGVRIQEVRIRCRNFASGLAIFKIFLDDNGCILASKCRLFVHVNDIDDSINGSGEAVVIRNGKLHIVGQVI